MTNIQNQVDLPFDVIRAMANEILSSIDGVSVNNSPLATIHLADEATQAEQNRATSLLNNFDTLVITASVTAMVEGAVDPTITCADEQMALDSEIGYVVLYDGDLYATGTDTVVAGASVLTLSSPVAGTYEVYMYRLEGNYASAKVTITVTEV